MSRPVDVHKQARSYIVFKESDGKLIVKPSHWAVGYTQAYCATPVEAVEYALEKNVGEQILLDREHDALSELLLDTLDGD